MKNMFSCEDNIGYNSFYFYFLKVLHLFDFEHMLLGSIIPPELDGIDRE